jgi:predicted Zn-dependent protease
MSAHRIAGRLRPALGVLLLSGALASPPAPAASGVAAATPASAAAPAAPAAETVSGAPSAYDPGGTVRYGGASAFRGLVATDALERQAAAQYAGMLADAARQKRLLGAGDARVRRVRAIAQRLLPAAQKWSERTKTWKWEFNVVRSAQIDANCLPTGKYLINTGMLSALRPTDSELAALMAHDIVHALREHARLRVGREHPGETGVGTMPYLYDFGALAYGSGVGAQLLSVRYDADDETEANVIGADIMARAGYDPRGAVSAWEKLDTLGRGRPVAFLRMHSFSRARVNDMKKRMPAMLDLYAKASAKAVARSAPRQTR